MISFCFNKKSSLDFNTIIVQELPDIVVPAKKFNKIKIDGRDGDIYQEAGYDDVTKTVVFSLKNMTEINEISAWLKGEGELILSNEPDKKYRARVLNAYSYVRNGRFREAKVEFICEPFKYLVNEDYLNYYLTTSPPPVVDGKTLIGSFVVAGTVECLPHIKTISKGTYTLYVDNQEAFTITPPNQNDLHTIIIDSESEKCYYNTQLSNRVMNGEFIKLQPGTHTLSYTGGTIAKVVILRRSRYL